MSNQLEKYNFYSRTIKRVLLFTGLWPSANPSILYRMVTVIHGSASLLTCCALLNFAYQHFASLHLFFKGFSLALTFLTIMQKMKDSDPCHTVICTIWIRYVVDCKALTIEVIIVVKMTCLTFYRQRLVNLHSDLATTFALDFKDNELRPILLSPLLSFYEPSLVLSTMSFMTAVLYWITPIAVIIIQLAHRVEVLKLITPFPTLYPWRPDTNILLYLSHYIFEIYGGVCVGTFTSSIDALFGYYIFQICGQLRTLSYRLKNLNPKENYHKVIRECISRHQILTKCQNHLEQIYGPIILWMLVTNAVLMCALIYQASHIKPSKAALIVVYMIMKSTQTLVYGWFGTSLENEKEMFREAIYASDWPGSGEKRLMTDVLVMMTYKPFVLRACSLSNISIDMFVAVSNTAVSYYLMIRTLEEQENNS